MIKRSEYRNDRGDQIRTITVEDMLGNVVGGGCWGNIHPETPEEEQELMDRVTALAEAYAAKLNAKVTPVIFGNDFDELPFF